jgi:hypothetical protein
MARYRSGVISKNADVTSNHSAVISKTTTWLKKTRLLPLKRRRRKKNHSVTTSENTNGKSAVFLYEYAGKSKM